MKASFAVIGNNWGHKIYNIIDDLSYSVVKIPLKSPKRYKNRIKYFEELKKQLSVVKSKYNTIWLAITPKKNDQFEIVKECLNQKFNLIIEKPWNVNKKNTKILIDIQKKNNVLVGFNFEYLYLNFLVENKDYFKKDIKKIVLNFHIKNKQLKNNHKLELGSHLVAIKKLYFSNVKNYKIITGFKKNLRKINIEKSKKSISHDFTLNKEKIIQKFINDYSKHLKLKKKFIYGFTFASMK